jgi:hypothetical protein
MASEGGSPCQFRFELILTRPHCVDEGRPPGPAASCSGAEAAKIGDVTPQIVRDWVMKFNANGPDGLVDRKSPGQPSRLNDTQRAAIAAMVDSGPIPAIHGVVPLARRRSLPMGFRDVPRHCGQADPEP